MLTFSVICVYFVIKPPVQDIFKNVSRHSKLGAKCRSSKVVNHSSILIYFVSLAFCYPPITNFLLGKFTIPEITHLICAITHQLNIKEKHPPGITSFEAELDKEVTFIALYIFRFREC